MASHLKVAAVIVTYEPDLRAFEANLKQASKQVIKTVVVDNGSAQQSAIKELCQSDAFDKADIQLIALADNEGLGAAHNAGINAITESSLDCSHVLILDQDTLIADDMVSQLSNSWQTLSRDKKIGALGGRYENTDKTSQSFFVRFGALKFKRAYCDSPNCEPIQADFLISSGTLFSIEALNDVGLMDEALFIDHVDTEWFLRAAHKEYEFYGVCQAKMTHSLGEKLHRIKLLRERHVPQHKPFRYYYIFRNSVFLYRKSYAPWKWIWNDLQRLLMIFAMYGLVVSPRKLHLKMMFRGIVDGLKGRSGKLDSGH